MLFPQSRRKKEREKERERERERERDPQTLWMNLLPTSETLFLQKKGQCSNIYNFKSNKKFWLWRNSEMRNLRTKVADQYQDNFS
jgi:hypothetical protein